MEFVARHEWVFARTIQHNPHEYTLRRKAAEGAFDLAVRCIREHGVLEAYWNRPYKTLYAGEHKYWTMGAPLKGDDLDQSQAGTLPGSSPRYHSPNPRQAAGDRRRLAPATLNSILKQAGLKRRFEE